MEALWESILQYSVTARVTTAGLIIGAMLGIVMHRTNFCTMGALSDINAFGDWRRFRAWLLAMAVAIVCAQAMQLAGLIDLSKSIYLGATLNWLSFIIGGLVFGIGMVFASGCGARNLIRVGGGDLKALVVVLVIGIVSYMTLRGLIAPVRLFLNDLAALDMGSLGLPNTCFGCMIAAMTGLSEAKGIVIGSAILVIGILVYCFANRAFRTSPVNIFAGVAIGLLVAGSWWATGVLGNDEFDPVPLFALTFVGPTGNTLQYLMTYTGATIGFGVAAVIGMVLGSLVSSVLQGRFHISGFADRNDLIRHLLGGTLMGSGAVISLGCTVGQGMSGISTLALGSVLALVSIIAGGFFGLKMMERGVLV